MKLKTTPLLLLLATIQLTVCGQPQKRDTLLFFIGHWQSKTVFKADSNYITHTAVGGNVTVGNDGSVTVQSQSGQQVNQQIDKGSTGIDQMESQLKQELTGDESFNEYHLYKFSQAAIDSARAFYFGLKLPDGPPPGGTSSNPTYQQYNAMANWCISQEDNYNTVINFYSAHKKDTHIDYPDPPLADYFNCWGCNRDAQRAFDKQCKGYDTTFFQPEVGLLTKTINLLHDLTMLGQTGEVQNTGDQERMIASLFKHSKQGPANNGPCAFLDAGKLAYAEAFLAQRLVNKADQLAHDVLKQKNYNATMPAVQVYLQAESVLEKTMGTDQYTNGNAASVFDVCKQIVENLTDKLMDKLTTEHDISYLADLPFICSLIAQHQELGGNDMGFENFLNSVTHYTLSLDMNAKINLKGGVTQSAHLKGTADMVVELDTVACVRLVLSNKENGVFTANLLDNTQVYPQCTPTYVGTHTYTMPPPVLILHFCNKGGADTLTLGTFAPKPATAGLWKIPCGTVPPMNSGINNLDTYFIDPMGTMKNAMNIKANAGAYQGQLQQMMAYAQQMKSQIQEQMASGGGQNSAGAGANIKSVMDMANNIAPVNMMNMGRLAVVVTLNNARLIIDQTIDAKKTNTNSQLNQLIESALYKVQLKPKTNGGQ